MEMTNIEPGQKLWYVPQNGKPHEITVEKVGRQYAHFGRNYRINLGNLIVSQGVFHAGNAILTVNCMRAKYDAWKHGRN